MVSCRYAYREQGARQHLDNFIPQLLGISGSLRPKIYRILLAMIVHKPVPERPGRSEPTVRKRRPKAYPRDAAASFFPTSADGERLIKFGAQRRELGGWLRTSLLRGG